MYFHHFRCAEAGRECVSSIMSGVGGGANCGACGYPSPWPSPARGEGTQLICCHQDSPNCPTGKSVEIASSALAKNIPLSASGKSVIVSARLTANEGRSRSSRTCSEMRWTRELRLTSVARRVRRNRVVLTPDAGVKLRGRIRAATVAKEPASPGRARSKP